MIHFIEKEINLADIDLMDRTYLFTFEPIISGMVKSIQEIGLLNHPILRKKPNRPTYILISGLKRVLALMHLNHRVVTARIIDEDQSVTEAELFRLALFENLSIRPLNPIEKSIIVSKLHYYFRLGMKEIMDGYFEQLSLGANQKVFQIYLRLDELEDNIKISILEDFISPETGYYFLRFDSEDRNSLYYLIHELKLGKNRQREFMKLLEEISKRDDMKISKIIGKDAIQAVFSRDDLNISLKQVMLRHILRKMRYPSLSKAEERFYGLRKNLKLPPGIDLKPPENFEGDMYQIELKFKNHQEFAEQIRILQKIVADDKLKDLDGILNVL